MNEQAMRTRRGGRTALLMLLLILHGCDDGTNPGEFVPADFHGEWQLSLPQTSCWEAMEIVFLLDQAGTYQFSSRSMNVDGRWGIASDTDRNRLVSGRLNWDQKGKDFSFAFHRSGESGAFGLFVGAEPKDTMTPEFLQGIFFDQNRQACFTPVSAAKTSRGTL
jgi:hypothetical protein